MSTDVNSAVGALYTPLSIRSVTLQNRIVMSAMTRSFSPNGIPGEDVAAYYRRRAEGETGLIITEGVGVDHAAALGSAGLGETDIPHMYGDDALQGWRSVVDQVHAAGGVIFPQLWHQGVMRVEGTGPHPQAPSCRPSGLWGPAQGLTPPDFSDEHIARQIQPTRPMSETDIADVIAAYGRSAANAKHVGFDGIAIHAAHGYLIDNFLWRETNTRTDKWGGDLAARSRFAVEVVRTIRGAVGDELPILFRFSQWKQQDFKARLAGSPAELERILVPIAEAGVDVFDASTRYFNTPAFPDSELNLAGWAKKVTGKMSMTIGGVGINTGMYDTLKGDKGESVDNLPLLLARFNRHEFDLVGVGRAILHDPAWSRKVKRGIAPSPFDAKSLEVLT